MTTAKGGKFQFANLELGIYALRLSTGLVLKGQVTAEVTAAGAKRKLLIKEWKKSSGESKGTNQYESPEFEITVGKDGSVSGVVNR